MIQTKWPTMITKIASLWKKFASKAYRESFVEAHLSSTVAAQIQTMRQDRGWSQSQLAEQAGMKQSRISVMEDPDNTSMSMSTLLRLASAFDVAVIVRFVPHSEVVRWSSNSRRDKFSVTRFKDDVMPEAMGAALPPLSMGTSSDAPFTTFDGGDSLLVIAAAARTNSANRVMNYVGY